MGFASKHEDDVDAAERGYEQQKADAEKASSPKSDETSDDKSDTSDGGEK